MCKKKRPIIIENLNTGNIVKYNSTEVVGRGGAIKGH